MWRPYCPPSTSSCTRCGCTPGPRPARRVCRVVCHVSRVVRRGGSFDGEDVTGSKCTGRHRLHQAHWQCRHDEDCKRVALSPTCTHSDTARDSTGLLLSATAKRSSPGAGGCSCTCDTTEQKCQCQWVVLEPSRSVYHTLGFQTHHTQLLA